MNTTVLSMVIPAIVEITQTDLCQPCHTNVTHLALEMIQMQILPLMKSVEAHTE